MTLNELENKYASEGKRIGGMLLLDPDTTIKFVDESIELGLSLTGVEGFKLFGNNSTFSGA